MVLNLTTEINRRESMMGDICLKTRGIVEIWTCELTSTHFELCEEQL